MRCDGNRNSAFLCVNKATVCALTIEVVDLTYKIVVFRCKYIRNIAGGTCPVLWIILYLPPIRHGNPDNKRIFPIAGSGFFRYPESSHAFDICCKAVWL